MEWELAFGWLSAFKEMEKKKKKKWRRKRSALGESKIASGKLMRWK